MTLPADHPPIPPRKIGVLLVNLGTPDGADAKAVKRYLAEFLSDRRVVEIPPIAVAADPARHHPQHAAEEIGACLWPGLARGRLAARRDHAGAGDGAEGCVRAGRAGRLGDALRQSGDRRPAGGDEGRRVRAHPDRAALSAILRGDDRDRQRQGVRRAGRDALAAGDPHAAALSRRSRLYRRAGGVGARRRWPRSISSPTRSSRASTACRSARWSWAIPIIAIARRPRGCSARRWAAS